MSDKRDDAGSPADDDGVVDDVRDNADDAADETNAVDTQDAGSPRGGTAVATRPQRPTGKRSRREATTGGQTPAADADSVKNGDGKKPKTAKKQGSGGGGRNPFTYVWTYLTQVIAELRKVIWPNRKQMVSYTTVVLLFLAFMVALIGGVDLGLAKLVTWVFG